VGGVPGYRPAMFPRALRLIRVVGVDVRLDPSLLLFAVLIVWTFAARFAARYGLGVAIVMATFGMLAFFGSILGHELAHALEARHRGMQVEAITLFLFGGVTEMHAHGQTARDELAVAAVGPYVSLLCAAIFGLVATFAGDVLDATVATPLAEVAGLLGWLNLALAVFNLVPGAPLDGGRVLRAVLWMALGDRMRALRISVRAGQLLALGLAGVGLWLVLRSPEAVVAAVMSLVIAVFLFAAARRELHHAELDELLSTHTVGQLLARMAALPPPPLPGSPAGTTVVTTDVPAVDLGDDLHVLIDRFQGDHDRVELRRGDERLGTLVERDVANAIADLRMASRRRGGRPTTEVAP
jgi:Zn-dependent protease